ncbi:hypothetical protein EMIT0P43_50119 [Pseudomonas jessenii]
MALDPVVSLLPLSRASPLPQDRSRQGNMSQASINVGVGLLAKAAEQSPQKPTEFRAGAL